MIMTPSISESNCMFNTCRAELVFVYRLFYASKTQSLRFLFCVKVLFHIFLLLFIFGLVGRSWNFWLGSYPGFLYFSRPSRVFFFSMSFFWPRSVFL